MKARFIFLLLACLGLGWSPTSMAQSYERQTILSYNIRHGAGMDNVVDLDRTAEVINKTTPDVVGLQEVDNIVPRSNKVNQTQYLAEKCGMYGTFGRAIPLSGGAYGVAILSKEKPLSVRNTPLPGQEKRTLLVCEFEDYVFACTHLDLVESNRLASVDIILEEAARWDKPFIICGDWNDKPESKLITQLKKSFVILNKTTGTESYSFPADKPTSCIDYIATMGRSVIRTGSRVVAEPAASDHRPVLVTALVKVLDDGIGAPEASASEDEVMYDLMGRRTAGTAPGLYIKGGRKLLKR